jgi:zinc transporter, ZIP family
MLEAALWGAAGASSLLIGAVIGLKLDIPSRVIGLILGFGAGTLISALAFELTDEAFKLGGADAVATGLALGALLYFAGDVWVQRRGAKNRMGVARSTDTEGSALLLGAVLDGIPESAVIGITLLEGGSIGVPILAAVFISNLPEALSSSAKMKKSGEHGRVIMGRWLVVLLVSSLAAALGYGVLDAASDNTIGLIQAFAAGAVLTMLADTMIPAAYEHASGQGDDEPPSEATPQPPLFSKEGLVSALGEAVGLLTVLGFALAYLLSTLE